MNTRIGLSAVAARARRRRRRAQDATMSFFVTSANPGSGGDLGGLEGADAHCAALAEAAGVAGRTWAAYLSTSEVDARDRIGAGPWVNAAGVDDRRRTSRACTARATTSPRRPRSTRPAPWSTAAATSRTATTS